MGMCARFTTKRVAHRHGDRKPTNQHTGVTIAVKRMGKGRTQSLGVSLTTIQTLSREISHYSNLRGVKHVKHEKVMYTP
jgi:hypothetical protein